MERGIYAATSGGLLENRKLEIVANNLANVNTVGFKASRLVARQQEFSDTLTSSIQNISGRAEQDHDHAPGVVDVNVFTDFTPGPVRNTEAPLDAALVKKNQFFVLQTPGGERLTRAGNFTLNSQGILTSQDGHPVLGEGGPIVVVGPSPKVTTNGTVMTEDRQIIGKLRVVEVDKLEGLEREEGVRFKAGQGVNQVPVVNADIVPQSVEMPNVAIVEAMVEMITTQRSFEGYAKSVQTISEMNEVNLRTVR